MLQFGILQGNIEQRHDALDRVAIAVMWRCVCYNEEV